jgi:hypothetical protein
MLLLNIHSAHNEAFFLPLRSQTHVIKCSQQQRNEAATNRGELFHKMSVRGDEISLHKKAWALDQSGVGRQGFSRMQTQRAASCGSFALRELMPACSNC